MPAQTPYAHLNRPYTEPNPDAHSQYQVEIYRSLAKPIFTTKASEWEALARTKVPLPNFNYVFGAASAGRTKLFNTQAFDRYCLKPRMLNNCTQRNTSVTLFGRTLPSPVMVGPVGVQQIMHPEGEIATARACKNLGVPYVLSSASARSIEEVAAVLGEGADKWYQLYWPRPQYEDVTASLLQRAKNNGFRVLVVTLDTFNLGWRPLDMDESYLPFLWGVGTGIGFSDPVWQQRYEHDLATDSRSTLEKLTQLWEAMRRTKSPVMALKVLWNIKLLQKSAAWLDVMNSGTFRTWEHLKILKELWDGPIVLKGIQTVEDAHRAIEYGMQGIIVSNHGGRQLDGARASLDALAEIGADPKVKESGVEVLFDSGVRTGSDVLKALALGAKTVLIGRPFMYGLAIAGQQGVEHVMKCIMADTDNQLGQLGKADVKDLNRDDLEIREKAKI